MNQIQIRGAREHNLKNISLDLPKNQLIVFTGLSGSGKSSLAFDTIFAEGQRRYVESLSSYARQFLGMMEKPDVDQIDGLSPAISIDQKTVSHNPRSTVGTTTEIYDYLRLLYARVGHPHCPECGREISTMTPEQIVGSILSHQTGSMKKQFLHKGSTKPIRLMVLAPLVKDRKGEYSALFDDLVRRGYTKVRVDGKIFDLDEEDLTLIKTNRHTIEVVIDRIVIDTKKRSSRSAPERRLHEAVENALKLSNGEVIVSEVQDESFEFPNKPKKMADHLYSENFACPHCNIALPDLEPRSFSFNSPHGACPTCDGIGTKLEVDPERVFNNRLTIAEGAIFPWARHLNYDDSYPQRFLTRVAQDYEFDFDTKFGEIPEEAKEEILFEGLVPYLERRYAETDSPNVRSKIEKYMVERECPECGGTRLKTRALAVTAGGKNIAQIAAMPITSAFKFLKNLELLNEREKQIAAPILRELLGRLKFLRDVGLTYLTLDRRSDSLSGGEAQRIRLASQIGSGLSGVLYVLDEPSIGLHARDHNQLLRTLRNLRDLGNTIIVVEHDLHTMQQSDEIVDFGPGAGQNGGKVVAQGTPEEIAANEASLTGQYLSGEKKVLPLPPKKLKSLKNLNEQNANSKTHHLTILGARQHNLKKLKVSFPLGNFVCVTGVSGSGKSTLVMETLYKRLALELYNSKVIPGDHIGLEGIEHIDKAIEIDQTPIGRTPRSNPATYTKVFTPIRELYASTPEAKARGYEKGRFSFNVKGGRCENCRGDGQIKIEMQFLPDVYVDCEICHGRRYNRDTLDIKFKDKDISDILEMTVDEAAEFFQNHPKILKTLETLREVGLGYIQLGQPAPTLSGGEAQRVKLASELRKRQTGQTVYILDEPTTGLHFADIEKLLNVLHKLVAQGNTVIVIEHNLDVIKTADWIIDLGPEGGDGGGEVVAAGTIDDIMEMDKSYTGKYLKRHLNR